MILCCYYDILPPHYIGIRLFLHVNVTKCVWAYHNDVLCTVHKIHFTFIICSFTSHMNIIININVMKYIAMNELIQVFIIHGNMLIH